MTLNTNGFEHILSKVPVIISFQEFDAHMRSDRHLQQLENMSTLLPQLTDRELQRMKAEEHIKRIEGKDL